MSIASELEEKQLQKLRERLRQKSDEELVKFGQTVRGLSAPSVSGAPDPWKAQLQMARAEWRRRYPRMRLCFARVFLRDTPRVLIVAKTGKFCVP